MILNLFFSIQRRPGGQGRHREPDLRGGQGVDQEDGSSLLPPRLQGHRQVLHGLHGQGEHDFLFGTGKPVESGDFK